MGHCSFIDWDSVTCNIFYIKSSLKGTIVFISMIFNFFYQYLLWAIGWHFNALFLVYTAIYGLNITILFLVIPSMNKDLLKNSIKEKFPVKLVASFLFFVSAMLLLKCLGEIVPTLPKGELQKPFIGYYNLFDQSLDIGIMIPHSVFIGILLLKRNVYGFLLSSVSLVLFINLAISIITGEIILGFMTDTLSHRMLGVVLFSFFLVVDAFILHRIFLNIDEVSIIDYDKTINGKINII